nr:MAG TPA: hypothetical protein [Microviridae sp.]
MVLTYSCLCNSCSGARGCVIVYVMVHIQCFFIGWMFSVREKYIKFVNETF